MTQFDDIYIDVSLTKSTIKCIQSIGGLQPISRDLDNNVAMFYIASGRTKGAN